MHARHARIHACMHRHTDTPALGSREASVVNGAVFPSAVNLFPQRWTGRKAQGSGLEQGAGLDRVGWYRMTTTQHTAHHTSYIVQHTAHNIVQHRLCTMHHCAPCITVHHPSLCTMHHCAPYTVHHTPSFMHCAYTLHTAPHTTHYSPYATQHVYQMDPLHLFSRHAVSRHHTASRPHAPHH